MGIEALRAELDRLADADLSSDPAVLGAEVPKLLRAAQRVLAQVSRRLTAFDAAEACRADGQASTKGWLRTQTTMSHNEAAAAVSVARIRPRLPLLFGAWEQGETTFDHVRAVEINLRKLPPELWTENDAALTVVARVAPVKEFAEYLRKLAESLGGEPKSKDETRRDSRRLSLTLGYNGMTNLAGRLTPEVAEKMRAMLSAASRPDAPNETRTVGQRNADALEFALDRLLDSGRLPTEAAERPHLRLTVDLDQIDEQAQRDEQALSQQLPWAALTGSDRAERLAAARAAADAARDPRSGRPRYYWTGPASVAAARRLACDATVLPIFTRNGEPLDVGRAHRIVPTRLRILIEGRDRHCRWPGCDMPGMWCQVHHVQHWKDGGTTDRWNLILLCDKHHHAAHDGRFTVVLHGPGHISTRPRIRPDDPYFDIRTKAPPPGRPTTSEKLRAAGAELARASDAA